MKRIVSHRPPAPGAILLLWTIAAHAAVTPSALFQDGAVLQREMKVPVWGKAGPGERVIVSFAGQSKTAAAGSDGKWMVRLDPMPASDTPRELTMAGSNTVTAKNIVVGEVWLASGQSNMDFGLGGVTNARQELAAADFPLIRSFYVPRAGSLTPGDEVKAVWKACSPQTAGSFRAVAYFFAREVFQSIKVPIGILDSSFGGTPAEAWTSRSALDSVPEFKSLAERQIAAMQSAPGDNAAFPAAILAWEQNYGVNDTGDEGFEKGWAAPDADASDWKQVSTGFNWAQALGAKGGGVFWLRKEIDLPGSAAGKPFTLALGNLSEEYHTAYFNGEEVGRPGLTPPDFYAGARSANVPGRLVKAGRNVIALRLVSHTERTGLSVPGSGMQLPVADRNQIGNDWLVKAGKEFAPLPPNALADRPKLNTARIHITAAGLFNAMINPLVPFAMRGTIWYQGESNATNVPQAVAYRRLLPLLAGDWRARWQEGDFPFYIVQLANYAAVNHTHQLHPWPLLRESQTQVAQTLANSGLALAIDVGDSATIHPTDKQDVGKRLAYVALAKTYGEKDVPYLGPFYQSHVVDGDKIRVRFTPGSGRLMVGEKKGLEPAHEVPGGKLTWFEVAGEDKKFAWAEARLDGDDVVVSSSEVPRPVAVRYAWAVNPAGCNLYNRAGLPASPFRTDTW